jgi:hypothetical protein
MEIKMSIVAEESREIKIRNPPSEATQGGQSIQGQPRKTN